MKNVIVMNGGNILQYETISIALPEICKKS